MITLFIIHYSLFRFDLWFWISQTDSFRFYLFLLLFRLMYVRFSMIVNFNDNNNNNNDNNNNNNKITHDEFKSVFDECVMKLNTCIQRGGEHIEQK
jgi:hypothetical protein